MDQPLFRIDTYGGDLNDCSCAPAWQRWQPFCVKSSRSTLCYRENLDQMSEGQGPLTPLSTGPAVW